MFPEVVFIWHSAIAAIGIFANILLIIASLTKTPKETKSYATLILNFAITDLVACFFDMFIQLRFIVTPFDVTVIYVFNGLCKYTGQLSCHIGISIFYHCFPHTVWSLLLSFSYRYYILYKPSINRNVLILIILVIYIPSFFQALIYWPTVVDRQTILPYGQKFFPQYDLQNESGIVGGIPTINEFASIYVIAHLCGPVFPVYIAIIILRQKIINELMKTANVISKDLKASHKQILRCLTFQAVIPSLFVMGVTCYLCSQLGIITHPLLEYSIFACILPMPVLSPFTYLFYIRSYRLFCLKCIRIFGESKVQTSQVFHSKFAITT